MNGLLTKCNEHGVRFVFEPHEDGTALIQFKLGPSMYGYAQGFILDKRILAQVEDPLEEVLAEYLEQFLWSARKYEDNMDQFFN